MSKRLPRKLAESWRIAWPGVLACVVLGVLLQGRVREASYDLLVVTRSPPPVPEVVIVAMDDASHTELGQEWFKAWDRTLHAQLIDRLRLAGARVIAVDILWDAEDIKHPQADAALIQAVRAHGRVVLAAKSVPHIFQGETISEKISLPFYALRTNALCGVVERTGEDAVMRRHFLGDGEVPSLAWWAASLMRSNPPAPFARRWLNYYGPPGVMERISFHDALRDTNLLVNGVFSNRVVFVGAQYSTGYSGGRGTDDFRTPYTRWTETKSPGVEIIATAYLNLLRGDWLRDLPVWLETLLVVIGGVALGWGLSALRPLPAALAAGCALIVIFGACYLVVWQTHVWLPWLVPCAVQLPVALGWSALAHTRRLDRDKEVLERELAMAGYAPTPFPASPVAGRVVGPQPAELYVPGITPPPAPPAADAPPIPDHTMLRRVGYGAYGEVWLARDAIGSYHAVKIVYRRTFQEDRPYEREFRGIQKFTPISRSHAGFVHILHVGRNDERSCFYYIMEAGDDENAGPKIDPETYQPKNLARELARRGRLPVEECVRLGLDLAVALHHLHGHQLVHRDIKPSNIIFVDGRPKFADIGLVTDIGRTGRDVSYLGTQGYIAPEGPGTAAADVYSLGKVLYQAATGLECARFPELPTGVFDAGDEARLMQINRVILCACEPEVSRRYQTAAELATALEAIPRPAPGDTETWGSAGRAKR